jgi:lipoprotein NlpD
MGFSRLSWAASALLLLWLGGCASAGHRAPVEQRPTPPRTTAAAASAAAPTTASPPAPATFDPNVKPPPPGIENLGKPGYYAVRPGDTLIRIGLDNGQNWRDIARWSGVDNPNVIEVGQVLRVVPPSADANGVVVRPVAAAGRVDGRPLVPLPASAASTAAPAAVASAAAPVASGAPAAATPATSAAALPASAVPAAARDPDEDLNWAWPAAGSVATPFDDTKSKGLAITGKAGDPVVAAADGRVVYAGSGLRGYGNLIIVKHNATYLSAYAHNQTLLVKEEQVVRRGQKIAEMGSSDADSVQLHFEIRRQGKPVDPARLLPPR